MSPSLRAARFALAGLLLASSAAGQGELDAARAKFAEPQEESANEAAAICVKANSVAAVELLLDVLRSQGDRQNFLPQAHYRDIAWGALGKITDPYARRRVVTELESTKSNDWTRQWCAELLGVYGDGEFAGQLVKALSDRELGVQRAAALALGKCKASGAVRLLLGNTGAKDPILRVNSIDALMRIDPAEHRPALLRGLKDRDGGVRCALLGVAAETLPDAAEALSVAALADKDWRPRAQAVDNLGAIRTKSSVDALIPALEDGRPAVAARVLARLRKLTGQPHKARATWQAWWRDHRETFAFPEGEAEKPTAGGGTTVAYHGIEVSSDRIAFLLDVSAAMGEELKSKPGSKRDAAFAELEALLGKLDGRLVFNVFCYAEETRVYSDKGPVEASARTRQKALQFAAEVPRGTKKDIWAALCAALEDPELDTLFLLSSGEPDVGTYVHANRVSWHLADLNRFHKLTIHTVAFTGSKWFREQLEAISATTGGETRTVE